MNDTEIRALALEKSVEVFKIANCGDVDQIQRLAAAFYNFIRGPLVCEGNGTFRPVVVDKVPA